MCVCVFVCVCAPLSVNAWNKSLQNDTKSKYLELFGFKFDTTSEMAKAK